MHASYSLQPGQYQYRLASIAPWLKVRVIRESAAQKEHLKVRWAGVELDANFLASHGEWKPIS